MKKIKLYFLTIINIFLSVTSCSDLFFVGIFEPCKSYTIENNIVLTNYYRNTNISIVSLENINNSFVNVQMTYDQYFFKDIYVNNNLLNKESSNNRYISKFSVFPNDTVDILFESFIINGSDVIFDNITNYKKKNSIDLTFNLRYNLNRPISYKVCNTTK